MTAVAQPGSRRTEIHDVQPGGGLRLHVREWGRSDGPRILFIHGWSQNPLGAQTRSSRRGFVFVEEATEEVAPPDLRRRKGRCGHASDSAVAIRRA